jgi:hypothetical protein
MVALQQLRNKVQKMNQIDDEVIKLTKEEKEIRIQQLLLLDEIAKRLLSFSDWMQFQKLNKQLISNYEEKNEES